MTENQNVAPNSDNIDITVNQVINDLLSKAIPSPSASPKPSTASPSTANGKETRQEILAQIAQIHSKPYDIKPTYEIYRATGQFSESHSDIDVGVYLPKNKPIQAPAIPALPPSYSTVIKQGRPSLDIRRDVRSMETQHLSPFTRIPPPSYAEIHGVWSRDFSNASSEQILLGPDPIYIWCSHCATVVITVTQAQRTKFTHLTAAALCIFGCWPCAVLPYCMNSCKNIYHYCPDCNYLFGVYRPW